MSGRRELNPGDLSRLDVESRRAGSPALDRARLPIWSGYTELNRGYPARTQISCGTNMHLYPAKFFLCRGAEN